MCRGFFRGLGPGLRDVGVRKSGFRGVVLGFFLVGFGV